METISQAQLKLHLETIETHRKELQAKVKDDVSAIIVYPDDDSKMPVVAYLRKPDRATLAVAMGLASKNIFAAKEVLFAKCKIEADPIIEKDDWYYVSAVMAVDEIMNLKVTEVKKN